MDAERGSAWPMWASAGILAIALAQSNMPTPFYVRWQAEIGFPASVLTILFSAYIIGLLLSLAISGTLVARFGSRRVILPGLLMAMVASVVFAFADADWALLLGRTLSGLAAGAVLAAGIPWVIALGGPERSRSALSLASGAVAAGAGIGPLLSGVVALASPDPVRAAFLGEMTLLAAAGVLALTLPLTSGSSGRPSQGARMFPRVPRSQLRHLMQGIASFGCALGTTAFLLSLGPSVLRDITGVDGPLIAGGMASLMFLSGALVQAPARRLSPTKAFALAGAAVVLAAATIALAVLLRNPAPLIVGAFLAGGGYGLAQLAGLLVIADEIEPACRSQATALLNMGGYVPCGLLPVITGLGVDALGLAGGTLLFAALVSAVTSAATVLIVRARVAHPD